MAKKTSSLRLADLRHFAVTRSLAIHPSLGGALDRLGFVQADPIRAPARAQDLILRHRVEGYRAGDLERQYPALSIEEDTFINYGFVTRDVYGLMHPRSGVVAWTSAQRRQMHDVLAFVRERGTVHPRDVDRQFAHGRVTNYWGGSSNASTHLLDLLHYRGVLRIATRQDGIRTYALREPLQRPVGVRERDQRIDRLVDVLVGKYAPLSTRGLAIVVRRLRYAAPQWRNELGRAIVRAKARLTHAVVDGTDWFWPAGEQPGDRSAPSELRMLAPFDPVVWDRSRFEQFWGWEYRFEAYTPIAQRVRGYYAMPLLWKEHVIGWANVSVRGADMEVSCGFAAGSPPGGRAFKDALAEETERLREFLSLPGVNGRRRRESVRSSSLVRRLDHHDA